MNRLKEKYKKEIIPALMKKFKYKNIMQVPSLEKVVISMGVGEAISNSKVMDNALSDLSLISGQKPIITKAKKSIASFKLRQGMSIGCKVTLRGERMYIFLDKLFNIVLPRIRDFRGLSSKAFDGKGNYSIGLKEQIIFPEIEYDKIDKTRGMNINIITSAENNLESAYFLKLLGCPIREN